MPNVDNGLVTRLVVPPNGKPKAVAAGRVKSINPSRAQVSSEPGTEANLGQVYSPAETRSFGVGRVRR